MAKKSRKPRYTKAERIARGGLVCDDEHKTDQSHKNHCDINKVLDRAAHGASLSHIMNHGGDYGNFADWDENTYEDLQNQIADANSIFYDLPASIRVDDFENNPGKFFKYVNSKGREELEAEFPMLAEPGRQLPGVNMAGQGGTPSPAPVADRLEGGAAATSTESASTEPSGDPEPT